MGSKSSDVITYIKARKIDLDKGLDIYEEEQVAIETPIRLFLNGEPLTTIMALPSNLRELAVGFLIGEGVVTHYKGIQNITVNRNEVWIKSRRVNLRRRKSISENGIILTSCSSKADFYHVLDGLNKKQIIKSYQIDAKNILENVKESIKRSKIFRTTGGVHSASIFVDNALKGFAEDVGRHNAVDKVIGICLERETPLERSVLVTSGRQTADIILKAARCKIPISVSMRAPLSTGVYIAGLVGITLICFARGNRMNVYSHAERVKTIIARK